MDASFLMNVNYGGFNDAGWGYGDASFNAWSELARRDQERFFKSLTTGDGVVVGGDTGGRSLRVQFLHDMLEKQSFEQDDAVAMKLIPKKKVYETAIEWTTQAQYGGPGSGFLPETGADSSFGVSSSDDNFKRRVRNVKFLAAKRLISLVAQVVRNIADPDTVSEESATLEIIGKANLAMYYGDSLTQQTSFDGFPRQIKDWVQEFPQDQGIMWDAGGQPVDEGLIEDIANFCRQRFGRPSRLLESSTTFRDTMKLLYPKERARIDESGGTFGQNRTRFQSTVGLIQIDPDPTLRANNPLQVDGPGMTGKPRTSSTADTGGTDWTANPFTAVNPAAATAGTRDFFRNVTLNTDAASIAGAAGDTPAVPTGEGNQGNRLKAGTYYYGASIVVDGVEGQAWIFGANAKGVLTGVATNSGNVDVTAGQIVKVSIDLNQIANLGGSGPVRNRTRIRIYRYGPTPTAAIIIPTSFNQFDFLFEIGVPTATAATMGCDNGFNIPGTDQAFLITEKKGKGDGWFWAQLMPLMRRPLPHIEMGDPVAMLCFGCPILWVPRHHIWVRNIGVLT